jgi:hypothetical protein
MERPKENLREKIAEVVRQIADQPDLHVTTEMTDDDIISMKSKGIDPKKAWFAHTGINAKTGVKSKHVRIPDDLSDYEADEAIGIGAHEGAHIAMTRLLEVREKKDVEQLGFSALVSSIEERPTDQYVRAVGGELGACIDFARATEAEKNGGHDHTSNPLFEQFCTLAVYGPHTDEPERKYSAEALAIYESAKSDLEFIEHCLPKAADDEETRIKMQTIRYNVIKKNIWPKLEKLFEKDFESQILQEILKQMIGQISLEESADSGIVIEIPPELAEILKDLLKEGKIDPNAKRIKADAEMIKALEELAKTLPKKQKEELEQKALTELEKVEEQIVSEHSGKMVDKVNGTGPHDRESSKKMDEEKLKQELEKTRRELIKAAESESDLYEETYQKVRDDEEKMFKQMDAILNPSIKRKTKLKDSGSKINLPAVFRWESSRQMNAGNVDNKLFESTHKPQKEDFAFTLLVDLSGSMRGQKTENTFKTVIILAEVLNRLGIDFEILGFQDNLIEFKRFKEKLSDSLRKRISGMPAEVNGNNAGGNNNPNYNDDGPCLQKAADRINKEQKKNKYLLVLSDGRPSGRHSNEDDLKNAVNNILGNMKNIHLIGLGLGADTEHVKRFYPASIANIEAKDLAEVLPALIRDIIQNPHNY